MSLIPNDWLRLRVAQVPRCRDLAIFVVTTDGQTDDYFTPAHARGVKMVDYTALYAWPHKILTQRDTNGRIFVWSVYQTVVQDMHTM